MDIRFPLIAIVMLSSDQLLAMEDHECDYSSAQPLTAVADVDANGIVNGKDISTLAKHIGNKGDYYALYDRNADGSGRYRDRPCGCLGPPRLHDQRLAGPRGLLLDRYGNPVGGGMIIVQR